MVIAQVETDVRCPGCGYILLRGSCTGYPAFSRWLYCDHPGCREHNKRWQMPTVDLQPYEDSNGQSQL